MSHPKNRLGGSKEVLSRRHILLGATALATTSLLTPGAVFAQGMPEDPSFLALSKALTGHGDLNPLTSDRIAAALRGDPTIGDDVVDQLAALAQEAADPAALMRAAQQAGQGDLAAALISAWYKGTVETSAGPVVVAYREALMYRPVADGSAVPTYCDFGPLYWQDQLPPGVTHIPHNTPEVL